MVGWSVSAGALVEEILHDRPFFETSGGGVTFSGGEPLLQPEFLAAVLVGCRRHGLHTAGDTCGYARAEQLDAVAPFTDLWLYDLKTLDAERHLSAIGVPLEPIIENLRRLDSTGAQVWVRIPLVPGFNDSDADLDAMGRFDASLAHTRRVHLLPLPRGAEQKYQRLWRGAGYARFAPPASEWVAEVQERLRAFGLKEVGGVRPGSCVGAPSWRETMALCASESPGCLRSHAPLNGVSPSRSIRTGFGPHWLLLINPPKKRSSPCSAARSGCKNPPPGTISKSGMFPKACAAAESIRQKGVR